MAKAKVAEDPTTRLEGLTAFESRLTNVLALHLVHGRQQSEQIDLLTRAGFRPTEIAVLLDTTANNVSVRLAEQRRAKKTRKRAGSKARQ